MENVVIAIAAVLYTVLTAAVVCFMWRQTQMQRKTVQLQTFHMLVVRLEETRKHRQTVRDYVQNSKREHGKVLFPLPPDVRDAADTICREFDYLGLMDHSRTVDSRLVDLFYAVPFVLLYKDVLV